MTTDLHISDEAAEAGADALRGYAIAYSDTLDAASEVLQAAGPALVAAELRRLTTLRTFRDVQDALQARADELDGGA